MSQSPIIIPGELGEFDDSGAMATWLADAGNGTRFLYYIGWNLGVTVPFRNSIGLAISENHQKFEKYARGPIVDRTASEPHFCASCCVIPSAHNNPWKMWYLSCTKWDFHNGKPRHHYHIKYAESAKSMATCPSRCQ